MLMKLTNGGITLEYINNQMTPIERDEYWTVLVEMERERLDKIAEANKAGVSNNSISSIYN